MVLRSILNWSQRVRERPFARPITRYRHGHAYAFMRSLLVVDHTPAVKRPLRLLQVLKAAPVEHFGFQRAMETLELAVGLGMVGPAVTHANAQAQQPDR